MGAFYPHLNLEKRRTVHRKLIRYPDIMAAVRSGFDAGCSPEQIAGRMRLERHPMRVSHETLIDLPSSGIATKRSFTGTSRRIACVAGHVDRAGIMGGIFLMNWL